MADLTSAYIGLFGVVIGGILTTAKDVLMHLRSESKDAVFLSIQVMALLERFADGCIGVAHDDGEWDSEGSYAVTTELPSFNPSLVDVQWKTLPPLLLYRIMDLPHKTVIARGFVSQVGDDAWDPPEHCAFFEERRIQFSELGLEALDLASTLRLRSGIPQRLSVEWNPVEELKKLKAQALADRAARHARLQETQYNPEQFFSSGQSER